MARHWFAKESASAPTAPRAGWLTRLRRDVRGNTLAMMAIALIPLCAIAGSAIDTARMYVVKVRLQQACDAGVLAGRKFMTSSDDSTLDPVAQQRARDFFDNNFDKSWMEVKEVQFSPVKTADQQVAAEARATVPMSLMKMFAMADVPLQVRCEARFDVADADIMMVLDTTGSMACPTSGGCSTAYYPYTRSDGSTGYAANETGNAKIKSLRNAVLDFWDTIDANKDPSTNIRYGIVPYSTTVNVGYTIPSNFLVQENAYASRELAGEVNSGLAYTVVLPGYTSANCASANGRYPNADVTDRSGWYTNSTAYRLSNATWTLATCRATRQNLIPRWRYGWVTHDVSAYRTGGIVVDPTKLTGENSLRWAGCIEERDTDATATFNIDDLPGDLDPDLMPTSNATRWRPAWPEVVFDRDQSGDVYSTTNAADMTSNPSLAPCPKRARRLAPMTRSELQDYVSFNNDFRPWGNTYHDSGMIWGTRFLAPKGPFANDTKAWPGRNEPNRHIVFMTDGDTVTDNDIYALYGVEVSDQRVTGGNLGQLTNRVNARFVAECNAAKARNITVWVVAFGSALNSHLSACATAPFNQHAFFAKDEAQLRDAFKQIAAQVAMLRVSK